MKKRGYPPKTIILPKRFMNEYKGISDLEHIQEMFSGYKIIEKDCYVTLKGDSSKEGIIEEKTGILVMKMNSNLAGLIIEKDYTCFFVEVFAKDKNKKQFRAGIFLVVLKDKNILNWIEKRDKIEIEVSGGEGYGFSFYNFKDKERTITNVIPFQKKGLSQNTISWYLSVISQFLDIFGLSSTPPDSWKPK